MFSALMLIKFESSSVLSPCASAGTCAFIFISIEYKLQITVHVKRHLAIVEDELPRVCGDNLDVILGQVTGVKPEPRVCHFSSENNNI